MSIDPTTQAAILCEFEKGLKMLESDSHGKVTVTLIKNQSSGFFDVEGTFSHRIRLTQGSKSDKIPTRSG